MFPFAVLEHSETWTGLLTLFRVSYLADNYLLLAQIETLQNSQQLLKWQSSLSVQAITHCEGEAHRIMES